MKPHKLLLLSLTLFFFSCASIVKGGSQKIFINSSPAEATVKVRDQRGNGIITSATPATLTLQKGDGYFGSASYSIEISKPGYQTQNVTLTGSLNGWYIAGNLVIGGLIGWLIVDPISGAMWTMSPEGVNVSLAGEVPPKVTDNKENAIDIKIVLLEDVPENVKAQLVRIR
jgi:hypothetical protein